jgi:hypothetical protein
MISPARLLILSSVLCAGCHTAQKVAVSSFRVIDTPARYIRERIDSPDSTTTSTTTTTTSDVSNPGAPVVAPSAPPRRVVTQNNARSSAPTGPTTHTQSTTTASPLKPSSSATPRSTATQTTQFPTARPVPGKPGYVYSVDPKGGIVDVTGYKSGDKAKDPYTQQVFIVP